ncbi:hypothetical protein [Desulfopila sp. IMCC35008]|uniref:hypothetical protein n=1 Tax=Desulfopila sp. IMCC35008 TaxID=2653858 RepID=UPI0013CF48C6|nr:hypothetical protein [Desulfopila sp. IMCC35008]
MDLGNVLQAGALGAAGGYVKQRMKENSRQKEMQELQRREQLIIQKEEYKAEMKYRFDKKLANDKHANSMELEKLKTSGKGQQDNTKYLLEFEKEYNADKKKFDNDAMNAGQSFMSMAEWGQSNRPALYNLAYPGGTDTSADGTENSYSLPEYDSPFKQISETIGFNAGNESTKASDDKGFIQRTLDGARDFVQGGDENTTLQPAPLATNSKGEIVRLPVDGSGKRNKYVKPGANIGPLPMKGPQRIEDLQPGAPSLAERWLARATGMSEAEKEQFLEVKRQEIRRYIMKNLPPQKKQAFFKMSPEDQTAYIDKIMAQRQSQ